MHQNYVAILLLLCLLAMIKFPKSHVTLLKNSWEIRTENHASNKCLAGKGKPNLVVLPGRLSNPISTVLSPAKFSLKPLLYLFIPVHTIKSERCLSMVLGTFDMHYKIQRHPRLPVNPSAKAWCPSMTDLKDDKCTRCCCLVTQLRAG